MIYIDVNIIIDVITKRRNWKNSLRIFNSARKNEYDFSISALTVFILERYIRNYNKHWDNNQIRTEISKMIQDFKLLPLDDDIIQSALKSQFDDFEDALQYETAKKHECSTIITWNTTDFTKSKDITIWTPVDFYQYRM